MEEERSGERPVSHYLEVSPCVNKSSNRTSEKVGGGRGTCQCIHIQHMCRYTVLTVQCIQVIIQAHPHSIHIPTH